MSFFVTDNMRTFLGVTPLMFSPSRAMQIVFFRQAPTFVTGDSRFTGIESVEDLLEFPGWETIGSPIPFTSGGFKKIGKNNYVLIPRIPFSALPSAVEVKAMAIQTLNAGDMDVIFVTTTPFLADPTIIYPQDGLTSNPDLGLDNPPPEYNNRWLFSWADKAPGATSVTSVIEGPLAISRGAPAFEAGHTEHAWLYPQRANMIANPSFELNTAFWSSNGTIGRVKLTKPSVAAGAWAGQFTKAAGTPLVMESNVFPTYGEEHWTIQFLARGIASAGTDAQVRVGFVWWDDTFTWTAVDWGVETWYLDPEAYTHITICRTAPQTYQGMIRIESQTTQITIDQVLCERGFLKDWDYFDGDVDYGARNDYSWYGGQTRKNASYSLWYNNQRAIHGRLFNRDVDDDTLITDEVMEEMGFVYKWVPAGTVVIPHIGVLHPNDLVLPVQTKSPTSYLPYMTSGTDLLGIMNPWNLLVDSPTHGHQVPSILPTIELVTRHAVVSTNVALTLDPFTVTIPLVVSSAVVKQFTSAFTLGTEITVANATHASTVGNITVTVS